MSATGRAEREASARGKEHRPAAKQSNGAREREGGRERGERARARGERKPSLIKDKGISATSRLLVTTTSASHSLSLQRPLSEAVVVVPRPQPPLHARSRPFPRPFSPPPFPSPADEVGDPPRDNPRIPTIRQQRRGDYIPLCRPCLFTSVPRTHSRLNRPFHHRTTFPGFSLGAPLFPSLPLFTCFLYLSLFSIL